MGSPVVSRKDPAEYLFGELVRGVEALSLLLEDGEGGFEVMLGSWDRAFHPSYLVSGWYRRAGGLVRMEPVVWAFVSRCLGHRLDRRLVLRFPRVAVLCAAVFQGGRWRECEGVLGGDRGACYLYARVLGGRLPSSLHNRLVLESGLVDSYFIRRYIRDFC